MRILALLLALLMVAAPVLANHDEGKGPRSLGGRTVERTETMLTIEADRFADKSIGVLENDPAATGGSAWNLTSYGTLTTQIDVPSNGVVWVDIRARGWHPADMRNPHMHIRIDGVQRAEWDVRGTFLTYPQSIPILAGKHTVQVDDFDNYRGATQARTLVVDWLSMTTPTLSGSPVVPVGGSVVVDAADIHDSVTGQLEQSSLARNNTQWLQWGVGCFAEMVVFDAAGSYELDARLKGDVVAEVGTRVQVELDGKRVQEYSVTTEWAQYKTPLAVAAKGPHLLEICYDNDEPGAKRTLTLDEFAVASTGAGAPPPPTEAAPWTSAHGGLSNTRHTESGIDATSVRTAREAWTYAAAGAVTGTPVVDDGVVYFGDFGGKLHAVKAADGGAVWSVDNGAGIDSSVALDSQNVYVGDQKGWLSAHKRSDGSLVWRVKANDVDGTHLYGSPVVHEGILYTGIASEQTLLEYTGPQTFRGSVAAFRVADGSLVWRTSTQTPDGKGVSVWSTPALDPALGLLFVGTGNSYGEPVSPYTDSILALKMSDGAIAWSYQATKSDAFDARGGAGPDRDFGASPLLFEAGGKKLVGDGDKGGNFFALDRATGALAWSAKADFKVEGVPSGQVEGFLGTASYADGTIYAPTTARSLVTAIDAATGEIKWATELNPLPKKYGDRMFASSTVADGVVLQGNAFGSVFALDAASGQVLANLSAGGAVQGGISLAGDRFFVPNVGKDLWSGHGGVRAFVVDPTQEPAPTPEPPVSTPGEPTEPTENTEGSGAIAHGLPGPGLLAVLIACVATASWRRRARG
ncbi:MAG TPA: PQQ-binding-like beta-propeller repeat protein [Candidatus Thermoplasmatota archaeon]|nr:PQQ-binding-like beta-propeller repeat protein [Candidatus Thermoplasmatota archaeon]